MSLPPYPSAPRRLAIIPARGGSKGLPGKNLARLAGESLTARAIRCAGATGLFACVLLSTDDPAIAEEGRRAGAEVPWLRPATLASDTAGITDAVRDALERLAATTHGSFDLVVLLEPTSPMRTPEIVHRTVAAAESSGADAAVTLSAVPTRFHPRKQFTLTAEGWADFVDAAGRQTVNRQELSPTYIRNGMCYATRVSALAGGAGLLGTRLRPVLVDGPVVNIDDAEDLALARRLLGE